MNNPMILVIDVQNVYVDGKWKCRNMSEVLKNINALIDFSKKNDVYMTLFLASENPKGTWIKYNDEFQDVNNDTYANKLCSGLHIHKVPSENIISKSTYSSYKSEKIKELLDSGRYDGVVVCGVTAACCVLATAIDIIDTGIPVVYLKDAVGEHSENSGEYVEKIFKSLDVHISIMKTEDYIRSRS